MHQSKLNTWLVLALSLSLAGCLAPGAALNGTGSDRPGATATHAPRGAGSVQVNIQWPQLPSRYRTQAIPFRATKLKIEILPPVGDGKTIKDDKNQPITGPLVQEFTRSPGDEVPSSQRWTLYKQEGLRARATLYAGNVELGRSDDRVFDIIEGYNSDLDLEVNITDAPRVDAPATPKAVTLGATVPLTGKNFGYDQPGWYKYAYLTAGENRAYGPAMPMPLMVPLTLTSATEAVVVIPRDLDVRNLSDYFNDPVHTKLYLKLSVDNVESNGYPITMPTTGSVGATVSIKLGAEAPAQAAAQTLDLTTAPYQVPTATGTQWQFDMKSETIYPPGYGGGGTGSVNSPNDPRFLPFKVVDENQRLVVLPYFPGGPWSPFSQNAPVPFLWKLEARGAVQPLPDEEEVWKGQKRMAKHLFFVPTDGAGLGEGACDVWIVPGVGPVRLRQERMMVTTQSTYQNGTYVDTKIPYRQVTEYRMTDFVPAAGPAQ